jgi:NAD-dependent SIR2 family protein deacetylase
MSKTFAKDYLKRGSWNATCDRCGFKFKGEDLRKEWQGFMVCETCYEPRHPQDLIRSVKDQNPKAFYRPEPAYNFIDTITDPKNITGGQ